MVVSNKLYTIADKRKKRGTRRQRGGGDYHIPKKAWAFWDSDAPPKTIQDILDNRPTKLVGWESIYLTEKTIDKYIDRNAYPRGYDTLIPAHKADWIRLALLEKYGGVWLDAGIIINDVSELNKIHDIMGQEKAEAGLFYLSQHGYNNSVPLYIDNWFIIAPRASPIISKWKSEFERAIAMGFVEYKTQLLKNKRFKLETFSPTDMTDTYLMPQTCLQKIVQAMPVPPKILFLDPGHNMFKIHADCSGRENRVEEEDIECVQNALLNDPETKKLPFIKLRSDDRVGDLDMSKYFES